MSALTDLFNTLGGSLGTGNNSATLKNPLQGYVAPATTAFGNLNTNTTTKAPVTTQNKTSGGVNVSVPSAPSGNQNSGPSVLDLINARLNATRQQAAEQVTQALSAKNDLMGFLDTQYGNLSTSANNKRDTSLQTLDQEATDTGNQYLGAQGNERRRSANQETANRERARALNRLDSSFYDNAQSGNTADLTRALGVLDNENASKQAGIGTRKTDTSNYFTDILQNLDLQKTQYQKQAIDQYNQAVSQAEALNRAGLNDFGGDIQNANNATQSRLNSIAGILSNLGQIPGLASSSVANGASAINGFSANDANLTSLLGNNSGLNSVLSRVLPQIGSGITSSQIDPSTLAQLLALTGTQKPDPNSLLFAR